MVFGRQLPGSCWARRGATSTLNRSRIARSTLKRATTLRLVEGQPSRKGSSGGLGESEDPAVADRPDQSAQVVHSAWPTCGPSSNEPHSASRRLRRARRFGTDRAAARALGVSRKRTVLAVVSDRLPGRVTPRPPPALFRSAPGPHPRGTPPASKTAPGKQAAAGMYTVAQLADRGIGPMTDEEIRAVTVGRTVRSVNLLTGLEERLLPYGADGNRSLMGLGDRPVVTPYEIRSSRRIETTLLGEQMSIALFTVDGRALGARDDEAGYVNYEAFTTS